MTEVQEQAFIGLMAIEKGFTNFAQMERAKNICLRYIENEGMRFGNFILKNNIQDSWRSLFNWVIDREFEVSFSAEIFAENNDLRI